MLFRPESIHLDRNLDCNESCFGSIIRRRRETETPKIWYGTVASGNVVMKDATLRDKIVEAVGALCFETEAAGIMNSFPCLVVRGLCDYSDSHKNKAWQCYAAATASAYAKVLLLEIPGKAQGQSPLCKLPLLTADVLDDAGVRAAFGATHLCCNSKSESATIRN